MNFIHFVTLCKEEGIKEFRIINDLWQHTEGKGQLTDDQVRRGASKVADAIAKDKPRVILPTATQQINLRLHPEPPPEAFRQN